MVNSAAIQPLIDGLLYAKWGVFGATLAQLKAFTNISFTAVAYDLNERALSPTSTPKQRHRRRSVKPSNSARPFPCCIPPSTIHTTAHVYIDGGVRNVYAFDYFADQGSEVVKHTIGSNFISRANTTKIDNVDDYASSLLLVMQENNLPKITNRAARHTIGSEMPTGIRDTEAILTAADAQAIYTAGVVATQAFLNSADCPF
ncbi:MAG: hypothetical protein WC763_05705 [Candidatus Paceibacterota bacterium]|jgi:hypothetical protein